jgi:glycosyltransferase involved in cell wall biosynthesis
MLRWFDPTSWLRAGRVARETDLLVFPWVTPFHAFAQRTMEVAARVPVSIMVHNVLPHEHMPFETPLARWVLRRADTAVVHAQAVCDALHAIAPDVRVHVIPMPPTLPIQSSKLPILPPLKLLCLGYVRPYKGFDLAVDAVQRLTKRGLDVRLTIAGQVWTEKELWSARIADPELDGRVQLIDRYLADDEVALQLRDHHIVVLPYRSGTQSAVVPLAFAAGRPVVATTVGGLPEVVDDGVTGRLIPPDDVESLAAAIEDVSVDLARYAAASANAAWHWEDVARALLTPLHDL